MQVTINSRKVRRLRQDLSGSGGAPVIERLDVTTPGAFDPLIGPTSAGATGLTRNRNLPATKPN
jgi:hypothetical protein